MTNPYATTGADLEEETTASKIEIQKPKSSRGRKRKIDDDEFAPGDFSPTAEVQDSADGIPREKTSKTNKANKKCKTTQPTHPRQPPQKYYGNAQRDKPEPYGQPLVWANKRQPLCDAVTYYNALQSAAYTSGGIVHGFLCDKEVGPRDKFDNEIMITRV
jgi:hypothetical protein